MLKLAADENLKRQLLVGLRRRLPDLDLVTVTDAGLAGLDDAGVLAWAAAEGRVLLTHDVRTVPAHAYDRLLAQEPVPGVLVIPQRMPIGQAIEDLLTVVLAARPEDLRDRVLYLPL